MSNVIRRINLLRKEIILVGTAHVSENSVAMVEQMIRDEAPDCVCIELDETRYKSMSQKNSWESLDIIKILKEKKGFLLLANLILASFQKRMGLNVGVQPGDELKKAISTAEELHIKTELVDRPIQVTLGRAWAKNGFGGKMKILSLLLASAFSKEKFSSEDIERLKQKSEMDNMLEELAKEMPQIKEALIDERDHWLGTKIYQAAGTKVLAVVGAGHLDGCEKRIYELQAGSVSPELDNIAAVPPKSRASKVWGFVFPAALLALLIVPFFVSGNKERLAQNILTWIFWNGGLAALGTILALGNILTVLTAFVSAPFATLNPFVGVGLFTAIVQASVKKPQVRDMMNITDDIGNPRRWYKNRIAQVLLVFVLSSCGAVIGNLIAVPTLFANLFKG